jgi:hypothetical protein
MAQEAIAGPRPRSSGSSPAAGSPLAGTIWFGGWLFTIAFAKLVWWKAVLGLVVWPYFLALAVRGP